MRNPHHLQMKKSRSTNRCENPSTSIVSELLADVGLLQELIIEILLRLPVKSLSKFKCVSKSWLSLISSPQFIRSHFSTSESRSDQLQHVNSQVLFTALDTGGVKGFTLYSALYEPSANVSDIEIPSHEPGKFVWIIGIVNGLVCLLWDDVLSLWNPVLRKSKHFRGPNYRQRSSTKYVPDGFGYDESNDDYKVVFVENGKRLEVYSLVTDSWSRIENCEGEFSFWDNGMYANGKIHWAASSLSRPREWKIVSLDMASEKSGEVQRPEYDAGVYGWELGLSGGKLVVLYDYKTKADLWVMNKYGVEESSWTKVVSITYKLHDLRSYCLYRFVCVLRNDEIVLADGASSLIYISKHNESRNIMIGGDTCLDPHVYVESLVSP